MLHAENLFEVLSFFALYDLDALLLTSRVVSQYAFKCAEKIPTWYFASVDITFWDEMAILKADPEPPIFIMGKRNIAEILDIALRNAIIGHLQLHCNTQYNVPSIVVHSLIPTNATLIVETLHLRTQDFNGAADLVDFLGRIRTIKVSRVKETSQLCNKDNLHDPDKFLSPFIAYFGCTIRLGYNILDSALLCFESDPFCANNVRLHND